MLSHAPVAQLDRASDFESEGREFESLRARQTALRGSQLTSRLPLILTWYGRKQGNGGTRNAGVIHAATSSRPGHWTALFRCAALLRARTGRPSAHVEADKNPPTDNELLIAMVYFL